MMSLCGNKVVAYRSNDEERATVILSHTVQSVCYPNFDYTNYKPTNNKLITKSSFVAQVIKNIKEAVSHQNRRKDYVERIK